MDIEAKGIKVFCPTRWIVWAESFQRIIEKYAALQSLWDKRLQTDLDAEMRGSDYWRKKCYACHRILF